MTDKVRMLLDVVDEVKREAPEDVPNWSKRYDEAKINLKNKLDQGFTLPKGVKHTRWKTSRSTTVCNVTSGLDTA